MVILGLTGSIGMGKSTAAAMLRRMHLPVYDSDAEVHKLLAPGGAAVPAIDVAFPGVVADGAVDRQALGAIVFDDPAALARLEAIVHPLVRDVQGRFLRAQARRGADLAVLDIPLLFETRQEGKCDAVVVISAPRFLQAQRVLARPGMTQEKLDGILARQMPDSEKRRKADFVVPSSLGRALTLRRLTEIVKLLRAAPGRKWPPDPFLERRAIRHNEQDRPR